MQSIESIIRQIKEEAGGLLEVFQAIEAEYNYIPKQAFAEISRAFGMPAAKVYETASFYSYLNLMPVGENIIRICESAPCHVAGAAEIVGELEKRLQIKMGETTADGKFTLKYSECMGQCQSSPAISINKKVYKNVTPQLVPAILAQYQGGNTE